MAHTPRPQLMPDPWAYIQVSFRESQPGRSHCFLRDKSHSCRQRSCRSNQSFSVALDFVQPDGLRRHIPRGPNLTKEESQQRNRTEQEQRLCRKERRSMGTLPKTNRLSRGKQEKTSRRSSGREYWAASTATARTSKRETCNRG